MTERELEGLVAVVTGGASGIGLETAKVLAEHGATVCVFDITVNGLPEGLRYYPVDVTIRGSVEVAVEALTTQFGRLDILVNNAGIAAVGAVDENDDDEWARVLDVNVTGMARVTAAALPWLRRSSHAAVVNVSSIAALNGLPRRALYSASKGAVLALTFALATDHVGDGIRVNAVSPGTVATDFVERLLQTFDDPVAERAAMDARQAIGRMVTPREVADAIAFLASPRSSATTGTALEVDGGVTHLRVRN
jgi:NAD(P)-dependent dehydrogenase (short-subunit alcohol dehydrogenase family)